MTIDAKGNIYLTGKGVTIFDKTERESGIFQCPRTGQPMSVSEVKTGKHFYNSEHSFYMIRTRIKGAY